MSDAGGFWEGIEWVGCAVAWLWAHPFLSEMIAVWALCLFVAWAAQRATIRRIRAANKLAESKRRPDEPRVWLMEPILWPTWLILIPPVTPIAMLAWLIKWGVILWGTASLEVDPELRTQFFAYLGGSLPPDT